MYECENCINECICNLCICCNMNPCICSMKPNDFITNEQLHKNCINKEKLVSFLSEFYNSFNQVEDKWFQSKADAYANILEYLESNE